MSMRLFMFLVGAFIGSGFISSPHSLAASDLLTGSKSEYRGSSSSSSPSDSITNVHPGGIRQRIKMDAKIHDARTAIMQLNAADAGKVRGHLSDQTHGKSDDQRRH